MKYAEVVLAAPPGRCLTYMVPEGMKVPGPGVRVRVPLGKREVIGYLIRLSESSPVEARPILEVIDSNPVIGPSLLELTGWVARYYRCGWGEAIRAALPPGIDSRQKLMVQYNPGVTGGEPNDSLLDFIRERGAVPRQYLLKKFGPAAGQRIDRLEQAGVVSCEAAWQKARISQKTERWLVRAPGNGTPPSKLSKNQSLLFDTLALKGQVSPAQLGNMLPAARRLVEMNLANWDLREAVREPLLGEWEEPDDPVNLNLGQQKILDKVACQLREGRFAVNLISGITSSGKTEVYLQAARQALELKRRVLILVPEIGMISQMAHRARSRLGPTAVWHSELGQGERYDTWRAIRQGRYGVVVGTRSAVFAPLDDLGLVIIDEEHDPSYKQSDLPPLYHGRDTAIMRSSQAGAVVLMGSATPSVESFHKARAGRFGLFQLDSRVGPGRLPQVEVVDLRKCPGPGLLSPQLSGAIQDCLAAGHQAMILLNRRGYAPYLQCGRCGFIFVCRNCSVSLTLHRRAVSQLLCHYCGYQTGAPDSCPSCGSLMLQQMGLAIQRLEAEMQDSFPGIKLGRMDADTTSGKGRHHQILREFQRGGIQVLLGTQMISKGHHFPNVSLVGIVNLDDILGFPDFRSSERAFQLMLQMSGRAGRGEHPGRVVIQTRMPDHPVLGWCRDNDYRAFALNELDARRECGYPPYTHLALLTISGIDLPKVKELAELEADLLQQFGRTEVLGPSPSALARIKGRYRWQILVKAKSSADLKLTLNQIRPAGQGGLRLVIDVDPVAMM